MKIKSEFLVFFIALLLFNTSLFNGMFDAVGFLAWKQVFSVGMFLLIIPFFLFNRSLMFRTIIYILFVSFFLSLLHPNIDILMLGYRFSGYGVFLFVIYLVSKKNIDIYRLNEYLFVLSFCIAIGVIIDFNFSFLDSLKFTSINAYDLTTDIQNDYERRVSFFLGSSSLLFIVLAYSFITKIVLYNKITKIDYLYMIISLIAVYFSGSRLSLIMLFMLYTYVYVYFTNSLYGRYFKFCFLILLCVVSIWCAVLFDSNVFVERIMNTISSNDPGNVGRLFFYNWFYQHYLDFDFVNILNGYGLGYLNSSNNIFPSQHFESSIISILIESGISGFVFFIFLFYIIFSASKNPIYRVMIILILINFCFVPSWLNYSVMFVISYLFCFFYRYE